MKLHSIVNNGCSNIYVDWNINSAPISQALCKTLLRGRIIDGARTLGCWSECLETHVRIVPGEGLAGTAYDNGESGWTLGSTVRVFPFRCTSAIRLAQVYFSPYRTIRIRIVDFEVVDNEVKKKFPVQWYSCYRWRTNWLGKWVSMTVQM